jgi:hypothetical protein
VDSLSKVRQYESPRCLSPAKIEAMAQRHEDWAHRRRERLHKQRELAEAQEREQCTFSPHRRRPLQRTAAQCQELVERLATSAAGRDAERKKALESRASHELAEQKKHRFHSPPRRVDPARTEALAKPKPTRPPPQNPGGRPLASPTRSSQSGNRNGSPRQQSPARLEELAKPRSPPPDTRGRLSAPPNARTGQQNGSPRRVNKAATASGARLYGQAMEVQRKRAQAHANAHGPATGERFSSTSASAPPAARKTYTPQPAQSRDPLMMSPKRRLEAVALDAVEDDA